MISLSSISDNYIESIIKENKDPEWLAALRQKALSKYLALPSEVSPLYAKYSDVNRIRPEQIYLPNPVENTVSQSKPHEELQHRLNELGREDTSIVQIGSSVNQIIVPEKILNQGVIISDLRESLLKYNDLIKNWLLANELQYSEDKFIALEAAAFRSGVFIYIPKNALLTDPIRIISSLADDGTSLIYQNKVGS
ncbi:MAG: hypothetical protein QN860_09910 [Nitrososphaeraceae archaeon]|nr:hypothetical protein [Nitrososphaeraceae archaeon]